MMGLVERALESIFTAGNQSASGIAKIIIKESLVYYIGNT